jgi:hypothetical protein
MINEEKWAGTNAINALIPEIIAQKYICSKTYEGKLYWTFQLFDE